MKRLGLGPGSKSLPVWAAPSKEDRAALTDLGNAARGAPQAVVLVGAPGKGHGTAWVLSRKHRLLVTNAHVADFMRPTGTMQAVLNGTDFVYTVQRAWYHPGLRRLVAGQSVRATDPGAGEVDPYSPDLAVLQLTPGGPPLPVELPVATAQEVAQLFAQPAAILGFPGHDTKGVPAGGGKVVATYHVGVISRLTDFRFSPDAAEAELQFVQYTMATWPGFSGSPVFLPNGHVVAVHNSTTTIKSPSGEVRSFPHGVRIDCLWELLLHHGLESQVAFSIEKDRLNLQRWLKPDERDEQVWRAIRLVTEARHLVHVKKRYAEAVSKCNAAIELAPGYADAYLWRGDAYTYVLSDRWLNNEWRLDEALDVLGKILQDREQYVQLAGSSDPVALLRYAESGGYLGYLKKDETLQRRALAIVTKLLTSDNLPEWLCADALASRGVLLNNLGEEAEALKNMDTAIRLCPDRCNLWETRADYWRTRGRRDLEEQDRAKARKLGEGDPRQTWNP